MSIYVKNKTTVSSLENVVHATVDPETDIKVGISEGAETLVINYLTNLYAHPEKAVARELFTNACDSSSEDDPVRIVIKQTTAGDSNGINYSFSITDYGKGMSRDELVKNYIQYANSTKTCDFDTVGSFGLGSKSPMALVPSYTVTSSDGEETNTCLVERTDKGIFARVELVAKNEMSFTEVEFSGLNSSQAYKMSSYIWNTLVPFSGRKIECFDVFEDTTRNKVEHKFVECPDNNGYPVTFSTTEDNLGEALYSVAVYKFPVDIVYRVGNVPYPAGTLNKNYTGETPKSKYIIDVTPGYFAFAPSREELPSGEELDHLNDLMKKYYPGKDYSGLMEFMTRNNMLSHDQLERFLVTNEGIESIDDFDKRILGNELSEQERKNYKAYKEILCGNTDLGEDTSKFEIVWYNWNNYSSYIKPNSSGTLEGQELADFIRNTSRVVNKYAERCAHRKTPEGVSEVIVVNGLKRNRSGKLVIPAEYRVNNVKQLVKEQRANLGSQILNMQYNLPGFKKSYVFVEKGYELSKETLDLLSFCNCQVEKVETSQYTIAQELSRVPVETRTAEYTTNNGSKENGSSNTRLPWTELPYKVSISGLEVDKKKTLSQVISDYPSEDYYVVERDNVYDLEAVVMLNFLLGKEMLHVDTNSKKVLDFLRENNYTVITAKRRTTESNQDLLELIENETGIPSKLEVFRYYEESPKVTTSHKIICDNYDEMHSFLAYIEENCLESIFMSIPRSSYYYENAEFYHKNKQYFDVRPRKTINEYYIDLGHAGILNTWRTTEFNKEIDKIILKHFDKQKYYEDNSDKYYALAKKQIMPRGNSATYLLEHIAPEYAKKLWQESVPVSNDDRYVPKSLDKELTAKAAIEHKGEFDKITSIIDDIKKLDSYDYASTYSLAKGTNTSNAITLKMIEMVEEEVKAFVESHPF